VADAATSEITRYSSGKSVIDGDNILNAKNAIGRLWGKAQGPEKPAVEEAQKYIDEIIESELKVGNVPQNLEDLQKYKDLDVPYRNYLVLRQAARAAKTNRGNLSPSQLARAARDPSDMLDLAQTTTAATKDSVTSRYPRWVGYGGLGTIGAVSPQSALFTLGAGQLLSTKTAQKALMGDLDTQKAIIDFLNRNPSTLKELGRATRNMTSTQIGDEYGTP
jgi:hypothetical protein